jgi:hypothetical protein
MIDNGESGQEPVFLPMYVRPDLRPVAIIGWVCALAAAITVYTWFVVQFNDARYEGVIETDCQMVWDEKASKYVRQLVIVTDEREDIQRRIVLDVDCSLNP